MQTTLEPIDQGIDEKERLFQCSTCKRSFTRVDHLMRHVRSHTKQKPYVCPTCSKGFARVDLLKRHSANHSAEHANKRQKKEIVRQSRVVQACEGCSQVHLRCEDEKPCSRCRKKNIVCRIPDSDQTEIDAAQGLLEFSHHLGPEPNIQLPTEQRFHDDPIEPTAQYPGIVPHTGRSTDNVSLAMLSDSHATEGLPTPLHSYVAESIVAFENESPIDPLLPDYVRNMQPETCLSGFVTPRNTIDLSFNWDMDFAAFDFGILDHMNPQEPMQEDFPSADLQVGVQQQQQTPNHEHDDISARAEAFQRSVWRYMPPRKNPSIADESHIALSEEDGARQPHPRIPSRRVLNERLPNVSRDKLLALILSASNPSNVERISSGFPSLDLLDSIVQIFFTAPSINAPSWFHVPTFSLARTSPELLSCILAAGAFSIPDVSLQKLGLALQEASMGAIAKVVQADNSAVRNVQFLQAQVLQKEVGMWSGISRKMEIAESFLQVPITMLRRGGRFRRYTWKTIAPNPDDSGAALQTKWKEWVAQESWLRLVYRYFECDRQSSMALLKPPLIPYSEMQLPIASPDRLWYAASAEAWKAAYLSNVSNFARRPTPYDCIHDLESLTQHNTASITYLYMLWGMIWDYRQMANMAASTSNGGLLLSSHYQELSRLCDDFRVSTPGAADKHVDLILEVLLMHLHVPLEDIQIFAGIAGPDEARHAYPALRDWVTTVPARQGLFHAAQILRCAEVLPKGALRGFYAMVVYHAGLVLWVYGMLRAGSPGSGSGSTDHTAPPTVVLNGDEHIDVKRFVKLDRGEPVLRRSGGVQQGGDVWVTSSVEVIGVVMQILRGNHDALDGAMPSLVESLLRLMEGLRSATK